MSKESPKIVLLEDEDLLRSLLGEWLNGQDKLSVVANYECIADFRRGLISEGITADVLIVDLLLPDGDGLTAALEVISHVGHHIPVVVISGKPTAGLFDRLSQELNGGWAFLLKDSNGLSSLRRAIDAVQDGLVMVDPQLKSLFSHAGRNAALTTQESQIMELVSDGLSNSAVAGKIFVSEKTVERVLSNLYIKYGLARSAKNENPRVRATLIYRGLTE